MNIRVRQGDSLWYYSQVFKIPLFLIADSNRGISPERLTAGQVVRIPGYRVRSYTIKSGDVLWRIAQQRGLSTEVLLLANPEINPGALRVGQRINIPERVTTFVVNTQRPYDYAALQQDLARLVNTYPFIVRNQVGRSVMGKNIDEIIVGRGSKRIHFNGSFHANEWITTPILVRTLNEYLLAITNSGNIRGRVMLPYYHDVLLSVVPMVNPDGVNLVIHGAPTEEPYRSTVLSINQGNTDFAGWKANIRGVDLNNQYPAQWQRELADGPSTPAPRDFPGYAPLSEPEAVALANLTRTRDFEKALAYHTQGEVIYWGFEGLEPARSQAIVNEYSRVSGYEPIRYIESWAGYKDWFIQEFRRPGFTVELGRGVNPLPMSQFSEIYQETLGIFLASLSV